MRELPNSDSTAFEDPLSNFEPTQYESELERALAEETIDAMQLRPFIQVEPNVPVQTALEQLYESGVSSLLVVEQGQLVGIFTERDVLERVAEQYPKLASQPVSKVMTTDPTVVYETDPAAAAITAIAVAGHRHVPVLGIDDSVLGIVSPRRVLEFIEAHL